jgi:holo-[acyl-carrier protein] synthase
MILGIGMDLTDVKRVETVYRRHGARFLQRIFTETERKKALSRLHVAPTLAKRFAAKEALAKALGTGMAGGVAWRQIGVVNGKSGKPEIELKGEALARLRAITPQGMTPKIHLTLTDEGPLAQALVMITAEKVVSNE